MIFDYATLQFANSRGPITRVTVSRTKTGRWQYRVTESGKLLASGMSPEQFAREFWFADKVTILNRD